MPFLLDFITLYTLSISLVWDLFAGKLMFAIAVVATEGTSVAMMQDEACVRLCVSRLPGMSKFGQDDLGCGKVKFCVNIQLLLGQLCAAITGKALENSEDVELRDIEKCSTNERNDSYVFDLIFILPGKEESRSVSNVSSFLHGANSDMC